MPDEVSFAEGASATCTGQTAYHAVFGQAVQGLELRLALLALTGWDSMLSVWLLPQVVKFMPLPAARRREKLPSPLVQKKTAVNILDFADDNLLVGMMEKDVAIENASAIDSPILKEVALKGNNSGVPSNINGIFEIFKTGKFRSAPVEIPFEEIDKGIELLR